MNQDSSVRFQTAEDQTSSSGDLALFERQKPIVEPILRVFRLTNTALDFLFDDVGAFAAPCPIAVRSSIPVWEAIPIAIPCLTVSTSAL